MKKYLALAVVALALALTLTSCESLARGAISGAIGSLAGPSVSGGVASAGASSAVVDFKSGEVLCAKDAGSMFENHFYLAKIQTPASAATKNQAEVLWISDGSKAWVAHVVESRKANKEDFVVGAAVFFLPGWGTHTEIPLDSYRRDTWVLGRVTDISDLFKSVVEINGEPYNINFLRVPTSPVK